MVQPCCLGVSKSTIASSLTFDEIKEAEGVVLLVQLVAVVLRFEVVQQWSVHPERRFDEAAGQRHQLQIDNLAAGLLLDDLHEQLFLQFIRRLLEHKVDELGRVVVVWVLCVF